MLDIEPRKMVTLGKPDIQKKIKAIPNYEFIETAVENIKDEGNSSTHTEYLGEVTLEDFEKAVDSLFNMLALLLINYFERYEFGSKNEVLYSFSILPPIIRYKVLDFLYKKYPDNISVIDKLALAMMKTFSVDEAINWVENNKEKFSQMKTMSEKAFQAISEQLGGEVAELLQSARPQNMYLLCKEKISLLGTSINAKGPLYSDFESALPYYKLHGIIISDEPEIKEFNDIMDFLYLGRKEKLQNLAKEGNKLVVLNCIS